MAGVHQPHAQHWSWRDGGAVVSLPASCCALSLPKLVFFAWPRGAGGVGSEATSCVHFCCVSPAQPRAWWFHPAALFLSFCCIWVKSGGRELGWVGQCLDTVWRDTGGPSGFGVPFPPLLVPSRDTAVGAASSLAPQSGFARACAPAHGTVAALRRVDTAAVQSGM